MKCTWTDVQNNMFVVFAICVLLICDRFCLRTNFSPIFYDWITITTVHFSNLSLNNSAGVLLTMVIHYYSLKIYLWVSNLVFKYLALEWRSVRGLSSLYTDCSRLIRNHLVKTISCVKPKWFYNTCYYTV